MPRFAFLLASAILSGAPALAQDMAAKPVGMTLDQYLQAGRSMMSNRDADGDGKISEAEFGTPGRGPRAQARAKAQTDAAGDAAGGGSNAAAGRQNMMAMAFKRFDANGDGYLDKTEIDALLTARFKRMDANGDGILTEEERNASRMARGPGMSQDR